VELSGWANPVQNADLGIAFGMREKLLQQPAVASVDQILAVGGGGLRI